MLLIDVDNDMLIRFWHALLTTYEIERKIILRE
ncbi:hypothetical protein PMIT1323_02493 [Prochlorococcus marinus str. MIT 1323]|nr:hypothetical protein PMIT1323_02493 [Prochlorococcus marinus str. MIT 1323]